MSAASIQSEKANSETDSITPIAKQLRICCAALHFRACIKLFLPVSFAGVPIMDNATIFFQGRGIKFGWEFTFSSIMVCF
jgi:hypothetical protein